MPPHCCPSKVPRQGTPFPPPASRGTSSPASMVLWSAPIPVRPTRRPSFPSRDGDHPLRLCSSLHPSPAPTWGQGFSGLATPRQPVLEEMATYGRPKFLGNPCVPMPCSLTPAGPQQQAVTLLRHGPRSQHDEGYPRCGNFGAQWHGLGTCCLRFARWIARRGRKTRCWLLARLYQTGFAPAGFLRKVSVTTPASLPPFPSFLGAGRVALGVTSQGSHRSGRAQLTHPARLVAVSRALCYPWSFRGQWIGVQCPRTVARARFRDKAPPSLHWLLAARVPRLLWYYGVLRFPYALPAALRFLRATVTIPCACVRLSIQVRRRLGARGFRVWQPLDSQSLKRWRRTGVPSSWGTLVCLCPVL